MASSFLVGKILERESRNMLKIVSAFAIGNIVLYALGVLWLMFIYRITFFNAIMIGVLPFFIIEVAKVSLAAVIYKKISDRSKAIFS